MRSTAAVTLTIPLQDEHFLWNPSISGTLGLETQGTHFAIFSGRPQERSHCQSIQAEYVGELFGNRMFAVPIANSQEQLAVLNFFHEKNQHDLDSDIW